MYSLTWSRIASLPLWFRRTLHTNVKLTGYFYELDKKSGYGSKKPKDPLNERIRLGLKELRSEIKNWTSEVKEALEFDPIITRPLPGETDIQWKFDSNLNFDDWIVTNDSDHNEGYSTSTFALSPAGKGLFSGTLSTDLVRDGRVKRAGYCNIRCVRPQRSFKRDSYYDWSSYTHLVLRVRGDGRSYMITLATAGYYDIAWNDQFHYALFTRGGPHWQISKIPFSKFYKTSKGRIQDMQEPLPLTRIAHFGISAADKIDGPFRLELDYVGLQFDPSHTELSAYEQYKVPYFYAGY